MTHDENPGNTSSSIQLPTIIPGKTLMTPGNWNGKEFSAADVRLAFERTDWENSTASDLVLDHPEKPGEAAAAWVGRVINPHLDGNDIVGDLELWDPTTIIKLSLAKARMGISPRIRGDVVGNLFTNFIFDNWGIVTKPAQDATFINLAKQLSEGQYSTYLSQTETLAKVTAMEEMRKRMGMSPAQFYASPRDPPSSSGLPIFDKSHAQNAMARFNQTNFKSPEERAKAKSAVIRAAKKFGIEVSKDFMNLSEEDSSLTKLKGGINKKMAEETKVEETKDTETTPETTPTPEPATPAPVEPEAPAEEPKGEEVAELSDADAVGIISADPTGFAEFAKTRQGLSVKELAKDFDKEKRKTVKKLSENKDAMILAKIQETLNGGNNNVPVNLSVAPKVDNSAMEAKINSVEKSIVELSKKLDAPAPVARMGYTRTDGIVLGSARTAGEQEMMSYLKQFV